MARHTAALHRWLHWRSILIGANDGQALGNHLYAISGPAPVQRASGHYPTGRFYQFARGRAWGDVVSLSPRESARCMDIDDAADIGERYGAETAQSFVGNSMSVFCVRALGETMKAYLSEYSETRNRTAAGTATDLRPAPPQSQNTVPLGSPPSNAEGEPPPAPDVMRHADGCPIWCTRPKCKLCCQPQLQRAVRLLEHYAWLRQERRKMANVVSAYVARYPRSRHAHVQRDFLRHLASWRLRFYNRSAPQHLCWWRWPIELQDEIRNGTKLGFTTTPEHGFRRNHPTGEHPDVMLELERFERSGFIEKGSVAVNNPLAYVPKKPLPDGTAVIGRTLVDMRRSGVNEHLADLPVVYQRVDDLGCQLYPNAWLFETDFADMFYHFKVHASDRKYCGVMRSDKEFRRFTRLPMGSRTSPHHCTRLTNAWESELHRTAPYGGSHKVNLPGLPGYRPDLPNIVKLQADGTQAAENFTYVDDVLGIAPDYTTALAALRRLVVHSGSFGFVMKYKKMRAPAQTDRSYNGFDIETRPEFGGPKLIVRAEAKDTALAHLRVLQAERTPNSTTAVSRRFLAKAVGKLQSLCPAVPYGSTFLRRMYDGVHCLDLPAAKRPGTNYDVPVRLGSEQWKDVDWWVRALENHSGQRLFTNADVHTWVSYTDGSGHGTGGCNHEFSDRALPRVEFFSGTWSKRVVSMTSNWKELRTILLSLRRERLRAEAENRKSKLERCRIYHLTDNSTSEAIIAKGTSTSPRLQQLVREIAYEQLLQQCLLIPVHVAGKRLIAQGTDGLSRGQTAVGAMAGNTMAIQHYNPLHGGIPCIRKPLLGFCRSLYGQQAHLRHPDSWRQDCIVGHDTLWYPHPLLARRALQTFLKHRMQRPCTTAATFLLPRRLTTVWGRLLRHFNTRTIVAGEGEHWPSDEFEPLIVARCPPLALAARVPQPAGCTSRSKPRRESRERQSSRSAYFSSRAFAAGAGNRSRGTVRQR